MSIEIFGNHNALDTFSSMFKSGRLAHSFLLYGDNGLGKKTIAKYLAMKLLCEKPQNAPCQNCVTCRNIEKDNHPDVINVEHSGKLHGFSAETIRNICTQAHIKPSNAERKVYILSDADNITVQAQNSLLKLIEEPPDFVYFIFTATAKDVFLTTVLSRIISLGITECSDEECFNALVKYGFDLESVNEAIRCFHGNIGMCKEYIENDNLKEYVRLTMNAVNAIIDRDAYKLCAAFSPVENDRNAAKMLLKLMDIFMRDLLAAKYTDKFISCYPEGAIKLSRKLLPSACHKMHLLIHDTFLHIDSNVNLKLALTALCAQLQEAVG